MSEPCGDFTVGGVRHGFRLDRAEPLPALRADARLFTHAASGARLLHLQAPDHENCLAVAFPTPPPDSTGLPHILEHVVLAGSRRFPVKEPFFEMMKTSMATFINAFTSQACTVYPVCSTVPRDFFNLADVYLDAVFRPLLAESSFRREGHHLAPSDPADPASALTISGVVYSEMRGAYSRPEALAWTLSSRGLHPETLLGLDSAGDPDHIPELTYAQFRRFHATYYHPSNALLVAYGDIPTDDLLAFADPRLAGPVPRPLAIATPPDPPWPTPRRVERPYPMGATEHAASRTFMTLNWLVGDALDPDQVTAWEVLDRILLGHEGAPLRRALIESGLGADTFMSGPASLAYAQHFHVGLQGSEPERAEAFEALALDTLARLARTRFEREAVEVAFRQMAYVHLEVQPMFPLHVLHAVLQVWPYGGDPLRFLRMDEHLERCRRRHAQNPDLFNRLIATGLLDNPHRLRVVLRPDPEARTRADAALTDRLAREYAGLSHVERVRIAREAADLAAENARPDPPEAVAQLPHLKVSDLPRRPRRIPTARADVANVPVLRNDVFSNGVSYLELDADLAGLPPELFVWLPRFLDAFHKMGVRGQPFEQVAARRAASTGALWAGVQICRHAVEPDRSLCRMRIGLKTLDRQADDALALLDDLLFRLDPRDRDRHLDVVRQACAAYRSSLIRQAHLTALRQAARRLTPEAALDHLMGSPATLRSVEDLRRDFDARFGVLARSVERIRDQLLDRRRWTVSFTGTDRVFDALARRLAEWSDRTRGAPPADAPHPFNPAAAPPREGLAGPVNVAYCATVMPAPPPSHPDAPLLALGAWLLRFDYCLPEIRLKGNAYHAGAQYDDAFGLFKLFSGEDPRLVETLEVFERVGDFVRKAPWTQADIDRAIIGASKDADPPLRPAEATGLALTRHVRGDTDECRDRRYEARLQATPAEVRRALLEHLEAGAPRAAVCVVSSRDRLEAANRLLGPRALAIADILP